MNAPSLADRMFSAARTAAVTSALAGAAVMAALTFVAIGTQLMSDPSERVALVANYGMKSKVPAVAVAPKPAPPKIRVTRSDY